MQKQKGFTIIELIVVIAIVTVLTRIVMINVASYINKSRDASIKENLLSARAEASTIMDETSATYEGMCTDTIGGVSTAVGKVFKAAYDAAATVSSAEACNDTATTWCACARLVTDASKYFCVDEKGKAKETSTNCTDSTHCGSATAPLCP